MLYRYQCDRPEQADKPEGDSRSVGTQKGQDAEEGRHDRTIVPECGEGPSAWVQLATQGLTRAGTARSPPCARVSASSASPGRPS